MSGKLQDKKETSLDTSRSSAAQPSAERGVQSAQSQHKADTQETHPQKETSASKSEVNAQEADERQKKSEEAVLRSYTKIQRSVARLCLVLFVLVLLAGLFCLFTANTRGLIAVLFCLIVVPCVFYGFKLYVDYTVRRKK